MIYRYKVIAQWLDCRQILNVITSCRGGFTTVERIVDKNVARPDTQRSGPCLRFRKGPKRCGKSRVGNSSSRNKHKVGYWWSTYHMSHSRCPEQRAKSRPGVESGLLLQYVTCFANPCIIVVFLTVYSFQFLLHPFWQKRCNLL
jgi:hypothetical protein